MHRFPPCRLLRALLLAPLAATAPLVLLAPRAAFAQMSPGSSGATTSTTSVQSVSTTTSTTLTFSRDQTLVISGSNIHINGPLTVPGAPLGGVSAIQISPATVTSSRDQIQLSGSDAAPVRAVVLNPELNATVRDPERDFDLAITQSSPGLSQSQHSVTENRTIQSSSSLSVFTAPFVP